MIAHTSRRRLSLVVPLLAACLAASPLAAQNWIGAPGTELSWMTPENWSTTAVPTANAIINNGGTVLLNAAAPDLSGTLGVGYSYNASANPLSGDLTISGDGSLDVYGVSYLGGGHTGDVPNATASLTIENGGTLRLLDGAVGGPRLGARLGTLTFDMSGDTSSLILTGRPVAGSNGTFIGTQSGGTVGFDYAGNLNLSALSVGAGSGAGGLFDYTISGGLLRFNHWVAMGENNVAGGGAPVATLTQTGGTVQFLAGSYGSLGALTLQSGAATGVGTAHATYKLLGGTLQVGSFVRLGHFSGGDYGLNGEGRFEFGDANGTGTFTEIGGTGRALIVRNTANASATFIGHGTPELTGALTNNGQVIARGFGDPAKVLDMSNFTSIANTIENLPNERNGWYATENGTLILRPVALGTGTGTKTVNWGEAPADTTIDLVNSARITLHGPTTAGATLTGKLLAGDHSSLPETPFWLRTDLLGVWDFTTTSTFDTADLEFRYDHAAMDALGLMPAGLNVYHLNGTEWESLTTELLADHRIKATGIESFSIFAVGNLSVIPEPSTFGLLALTLAGLAMRRRRAG